MSRNNFCPDSRSYGVVIRTRQENLPMSDQFLLTQAQLKRIESHFPKPRGDDGVWWVELFMSSNVCFLYLKSFSTPTTVFFRTDDDTDKGKMANVSLQTVKNLARRGSHSL